MPAGRICALDVSDTIKVECAAVARSAQSQDGLTRPPAPQLTTMRLLPEDSSKAFVPACASSAKALSILRSYCFFRCFLSGISGVSKVFLWKLCFVPEAGRDARSTNPFTF